MMNFREALLKNRNPVGTRKIHFVERTSRDVLEQADALPFWSQDYTQLDRGSFTGSIMSVTGRNMQIFRESMNRAVDQIASAPEDTYVIGIPTIIEGDASWGGVQVKSDSLITLDKNGELLFRTSHFSEITAAVISAEHLEEYAGKVEGIDLRKLMDNVNPVEIIPTDVAQRLLSALNSSTNYISKSSGDPNIQHILRHFEDNLLDTCLQALLHASDCKERHYDQRIHRYIVSRVRDLTLSIDGDCLTIGEICINLRISRRTLNHAFSRVLGITPVEYMRNLRLHRVRSELQSSPYETTIANIAAKWGFWHMSLFSRYYRELFGESPSETLLLSKELDK
ncbi:MULTISPECIES: helix-turn-helix domain-containing protein [unclassified Methylophaga]|uniref:helix-turn-helix domain-containing protein n=1 Tax=unclassified Methylophaga TaxID=2629249 RepID=UPI0025DF963F|nr:MULTISPECIES: helix-turn-helix domain-containing protein [unclassified Methylophaga]